MKTESKINKEALEQSKKMKSKAIKSNKIVKK